MLVLVIGFQIIDLLSQSYFVANELTHSFLHVTLVVSQCNLNFLCFLRSLDQCIVLLNLHFSSLVIEPLNLLKGYCFLHLTLLRNLLELLLCLLGRLHLNLDIPV